MKVTYPADLQLLMHADTALERGHDNWPDHLVSFIITHLYMGMTTQQGVVVYVSI